MAELRLVPVQAWVRVLYAIVLLPILAALVAALAVGYLLWGSTRSYDRSQDLLAELFEAGATDQPVARLVSDTIDLDAFVMAGISNDALTDGPGRYPGTAAPGQRGTIAIAGRRATFGAPFARLDELEIGDEIRLDTVDSSFVYVVGDTRRNRGSASLIVSPSTPGILADTGRAQLVLISLHPRFSGRQRFVVFAELDGEPSVAAAGAGLAADAPVGLGAEPYDWQAMAPGLGLGIAAWVSIWLLGRPTKATAGYLAVAIIAMTVGTLWAASIAAGSLAPY